jgi:hypothetical protein
LALQIARSPFASFNQGPTTAGYCPREIVERVDTNGGAIWVIDAVNHPPALGGA